MGIQNKLLDSESNLWAYENKAAEKGFRLIAGVDEAGRGPLAGPVVSAAVILPGDFSVPGVNDSKKLTPAKRFRLYDEIRDNAVAVGVGIVGPGKIDCINILQASLLSMDEAVRELSAIPDYLLIDGIFPIHRDDIPQEPVKKGDSLSISIAAASIIAKETRDRIMLEYDRKYPSYGFASHKGYPTRAHKQAIRDNGICPIHRKTFRGVREHLDP